MGQNEHAKRAATVLTIAQHKFKQALKKEDNEARLHAVAVELSSQFLSDIDAVLKQHTPANIQKCTVWIVKHIAPSKTRITSLGDYLISVSKTIFQDQQPGPAAVASATARTAARSRFVILLIINDVLHTDKFHQRSTGKHGIFCKESVAYIPELVELAASCVVEKESHAEKRLRAILNYWAVNQMVGAEDMKALRERTDEVLLIAQGGTPVRKRNYLLPEYHGDRNVPWFDLPASYMLEQMIKQPNRPIDPYRIKVAKLDKKPVTPHVRKLLDNYFENIDLKYVPTGDNPTGETKKYKLWLDPMGQIVKQNKETGETITIYNGYGWSMKLCKDMQKNGVPETIEKAREEAQQEEEMTKSQNPPQRRRRISHSPRRRRRSSSQERGRGLGSYDRHSSRSSYDSRNSRSASRDRSHGHRGRSPNHEGKGSDDRGRKYDERERDQPRAPPRPYVRDPLHSGSQWNAPNAPNRNMPTGPSNNQHPMASESFGQGLSQPPQPSYSAPPFIPQPPMPTQFPGQFPLQAFPPPPPLPFQSGPFPGGIPPPPPPNYSGPFPPPLPNMTTMPNSPYNFGGNQFANAYGNNFSYGNNPGYGQNQGNFQGNFQGGRGGFRGNAQGGGNYNNRGGYSGQQRGQRGGRW